VPLGAALAFVAHCRVEEEVSPRLDVLGRTSVTREGARGKIGMRQVARVFIGRLRERAHCSLLYFRWPRWSAGRETAGRENSFAYVIYLIL
jgi:hypothetical protein